MKMSRLFLFLLLNDPDRRAVVTICFVNVNVILAVLKYVNCQYLLLY